MVQMQNAEEFQKIGKDNVDLALKSFGAWSKGAQAIAVEMADYTKSSFELSTSTMEKMLGVKSIEQAVEIQQTYYKTAYESLVAEMTKIRELYTGLAKEAFKPYEATFSKFN